MLARVRLCRRLRLRAGTDAAQGAMHALTLAQYTWQISDGRATLRQLWSSSARRLLQAAAL